MQTETVSLHRNALKLAYIANSIAWESFKQKMTLAIYSNVSLATQSESN